LSIEPLRGFKAFFVGEFVIVKEFIDSEWHYVTDFIQGN